MSPVNSCSSLTKTAAVKVVDGSLTSKTNATQKTESTETSGHAYYERFSSDPLIFGLDKAKSSDEAVESEELVFYHVSPATNVVSRCEDPDRCPVGVARVRHYRDPESAFRNREAAVEMDSYIDPLPQSFEDALLVAAQGGFVSATPAYPKFMDSQMDLLLDPFAIEYLATKLCVIPGEKKRSQYASVLTWVVTTLSSRTGSSPERIYEENVEPFLLTTSARRRVEDAIRMSDVASSSDVLSFAGRLWLFRRSPYHSRAKLLLFGSEGMPDGYTPKTEKVYEEIDNTASMRKMNVDLSKIPDNVFGYDIETDTSRGFGLRPTRSQITEVVLSSRNKSWVFAGDERHILESFAAKLNEQPKGSVIVGWNNRCFDNIALQTRAEFHDIRGWGGKLESSMNYTAFSSVGPLAEPQSLVWRTPVGDLLGERDVFQMKAQVDAANGNRFTRGLKPFVQSLGCRPVTVDRARLHELSPEERSAYVLSDGLMTLQALSAVEDLMDKAGLL